jgi:NADH-quinone oxidoreductase subunit G
MNRAVAPGRLLAQLATLAGAVAAAAGQAVPRTLEPAVAAAGTDPELEELARRLLAAGRCTVLLGTQATDHPEFSRLRLLAGWIARLSGASFGYLPAAANSAGGWLAGVLPHRLPGGRPAESVGLAAGEMLAQPRRAYLLLGVEPELDCADGPAARAALEQADFVVNLNAFVSAGALEWAHVLLPVAAFGESAGTFVNLEARWQSFQGAVAPPGEARPAWKVLRVLGNLAGLDGFDFTSADQVADEVHELCRDLEPDNSIRLGQRVTLADSLPDLERAGTVPPYSADALVRRSGALQASPLGARPEACLNPDQARRLGVAGGDLLELRQGPATCTLPVRLDDRVADHCVWVPAALDETWSLGAPHGPLEAAPVARRAEARA